MPIPCIQCERYVVRKTKNYIAPFEVVVHNRPYDLWVSFLGKVYDITGLSLEFDGQDCMKPLLAFAGKDISHWFDDRSGEIRHFQHPITGVRVPYCPYGPVPHVDAQVPTTQWKPLDCIPWWMDEDKYMVGKLTKRVVPIRIINVLTGREALQKVCCEDTFHRILERHRLFNTDGYTYTWRYHDKTIDMEKTMEENGILDERDRFTDAGLPENIYIPSVLLYYNDDFKYYH